MKQPIFLMLLGLYQFVFGQNELTFPWQKYTGEQMIAWTHFQEINATFIPTKMLKAHHVLNNPNVNPTFIEEEYKYARKWGLSDREAIFFAIQAFRSTNADHAGDHSTTPPDAWYACEKVANALNLALKEDISAIHTSVLTQTVNKEKLDILHPIAKYAFIRLIQTGESWGWSAYILSTTRSLSSQSKLVEQGKSGSKVSAHNMGLGIDVKFIKDNGDAPSLAELRALRNDLYQREGIFIGEIFHYIEIESSDQANSTAHERNHWNFIPNSHNFQAFLEAKNREYSAK